MALPGDSTRHGTKVAVAILLLWFAGMCLFIAFLSGKTAALTSGKDSSGKAQGPADMSELATRIADNVQALENQSTTTQGAPTETPGQGGGSS